MGYNGLSLVILVYPWISAGIICNQQLQSVMISGKVYHDLVSFVCMSVMICEKLFPLSVCDVSQLLMLLKTNCKKSDISQLLMSLKTNCKKDGVPWYGLLQGYAKHMPEVNQNSKTTGGKEGFPVLCYESYLHHTQRANIHMAMQTNNVLLGKSSNILTSDISGSLQIPLIL